MQSRDLIAADEPTTLAVATVGADGGATYDFYVEGTADWQWSVDELPAELADDVTALHTGSMACRSPRAPRRFGRCCSASTPGVR